MALKRKQWLLCLGGLLLAVCGIAGGLFYYGEMQKRPVASPLGGTMRVGENVLYLTDAAIGTAPDWESWRQILQKRSFDRVEISGSLLFAGHTLPIQRGEMHRNSAGTWEISLESSLNRSPLLLSGTAAPVQETFTGKYAAALSAGEWKQHPFFGALRLQGIARTRGNVSIAGQKITLHPASAMPDEGARIFAGALELQPGQQGVEGDGAAIFLPGGALILPVLHLADPVLTPQNGAFAVTSTAQWLSPMQMAQQ
ncbi:MAG: hypothetical protein J6R85_06925, partial [Lentisphaeria bacterium]|nr:hypothetical protein [Lentisphaeria bacterium]